MEANPFATTLCIAIERLRMPKRALRNMKEELRAQRIPFWEHIADSIRTAIGEAGVDIEGVTVEAEVDEDEEEQRYFRIQGIRSDEAATVRAIFEQHFIVADDDFDSTDYDEEEGDESWRGDPEDQDE